MIVRKLEAWIIWKSKIEIAISIIAIIGSISILSNEDTILNHLHKMLQCVAATAWHLATQ